MSYEHYPAVHLPVSKSVANRLLILQARAGEALMPVDEGMPDDVRVLHGALRALDEKAGGQEEITVDVGNCGTAMRFLTAYCALSGRKAVLTGCERMRERPIGQLVEALRGLGARIEYMAREGFPPLRIEGVAGAQVSGIKFQVRLMQPQSTQFVSALLLMGVEVETDVSSPYIEMTRQVCARFAERRKAQISGLGFQVSGFKFLVERDWSAAAFWYEWVAIHGGGLRLEGLRADSMQGDKAAAKLFARLGVKTTYEDDNVVIERMADYALPSSVQWNFASTPDLYPAAAIACEQLGVRMEATGTESLTIKESDRLRAVREHRTYHDHRIAMALMAADLPCDDRECVGKSYPAFGEELRKLYDVAVVVPRRGVNDEGKGKKWALRRLIGEASGTLVWMRDDDVRFSGGEQAERRRRALAVQVTGDADLLILPLRMRTGHRPNLLERLQMAEYAAIQGLTIAAARRGRAVMCSGANLIARRERWLESYGELHPKIASGDDMFLLESFKRRGLTVAVSDDERLTAEVAPVGTWRALWRQRMRWAGKAPAYRDRDIIRCGAAVTALNIMQLVCPLIILLKFPAEYALIRSREPETRFGDALLLELVYPYYLLICLVGGLLKGRKGQNF